MRSQGFLSGYRPRRKRAGCFWYVVLLACGFLLILYMQHRYPHQTLQLPFLSTPASSPAPVKPTPKPNGSVLGGPRRFLIRS
jgi:hypothetical protein